MPAPAGLMALTLNSATLNPATEATLAALVTMLVASLVLTVLIRRRGAAVTAPAAAPATKVQFQRIQRATASELPADLQRKLRQLTDDMDRSIADAAEARVPEHVEQGYAQGAPDGYGAAPSQAQAGGGSAFQLSESDALGEVIYSDRIRDSTARFKSLGFEDDMTRAFQEPEPPVDARTFFGEDIVPVGSDAQDDSTQFFGSDDATASIGSETRFFNPADDATASIGSETRFFGADDLTGSIGSETRFFTPTEIEVDAADADSWHAGDASLHHAGDVPLQIDGATGMLQALPPSLAATEARAASARELSGSSDSAHDVEPSGSLLSLHGAEQLGSSLAAVPGVNGDRTDFLPGTSALQALPQATGRVDAEALVRARACLAAVSAPEIVALVLLDGGGNVLVGETDEDLTGELRALMDEAGMGSAADVDQPVRLGDDSKGALLLMPTGVNALLGALVLESGDPRATRSDLRRVAHQLGEVMRRAS